METKQIRDTINPWLATDFEHQMLDAAINNIEDTVSPIRFNNFAYVVRELIRHILERLAPDQDVLATSWFKPEDPEKPKMITRIQRMKYAVQGGLYDSFVEKTLDIDVTDVTRSFKKAIDKLSKYTHINPETFGVDEEEVEKNLHSLLISFKALFLLINETKQKYDHHLVDLIDKEVLEQMYYDTINEVDILSTHSTVEGYTINDIDVDDVDLNNVSCMVSGSVEVRLQYGSDGDQRRGDGMVMYKEFPFKSTISARIDETLGEFKIDTDSLEVNTDSFYGYDVDEDIEEEIRKSMLSK